MQSGNGSGYKFNQNLGAFGALQSGGENIKIIIITTD